MRNIKPLFFALLLFNTAFAGLMLNRSWANWHTRFGKNARAAEIEPWEWRHHFRAAIDRMGRGDAAGAAKSLTRAYPGAPFFWPIVNNLALAYALNGNVEQAKVIWEELIDMFPQNAAARHNLGVAKRVR